MKTGTIFMAVVLSIAITVSCKKKDVNNEVKTTSASDVVKDYFGFNRAADGIILKTSSATTNSLTLKSAKTSSSNWPDFYNDPLDHMFLDSCGLNHTVSTNEYGDVVSYYDYGQDGVNCPSGYIKKGNATRIFPTTSARPQYSLIVHCTFEYTATGKCFTLDGSITNLGEDTVRIENSSIKIGECTKEFQYTKAQKYYYKGTSPNQIKIIYEGSAQYAGTTATYNVTIIQPIERNNSIGSFITKGIEKVTYIKNGVNGEFTIDYGDGTNDSKATITENGQSYEVDYVALQDEMYNYLN